MENVNVTKRSDKSCQFCDYVTTDRSGILENRHHVHAAVVDAGGKLLFSVGDPDRMTLARSAAKPAQALAIVETGAMQRYSFDEADLALMCASHSSEERHISRAKAMLAKTTRRESDLRCGGHPALSNHVNTMWTKRDFTPTALCNNCSGKHVGMLAGACAIGSEKLDYHLPDHPMQLRVKRVVEDLSEASNEDIRWGLDGCNLPAPALPLRCTSLMYAKFAAAADAMGSDSGQLPQRTQDLASIYNAMARYPEMVGGEGRFCTVLMEAFGGTLVGKLGADACYGVGVRSSDCTGTVGSNGALGISVKVEDGSIEILYAVVVEILAQLKIGTPEQRQRLAAFHYLERRNTMNIVTGNVSMAFKVRPV